MALLSIKIEHHAETPKHNDYKRHDKARIQQYSSSSSSSSSNIYFVVLDMPSAAAMDRCAVRSFSGISRSASLKGVRSFDLPPELPLR